MKKIIALLLVGIMLIATSTCFAESLLPAFNEKLKGTWETYNEMGKQDKMSKPKIEKFTFPSNNEKSIESSYTGINNSKYDIFLVEEGCGDIWLIINGGFLYTAKIAFSEDGNFLYVLGSTSDIYGIYRKVQ